MPRNPKQCLVQNFSSTLNKEILSRHLAKLEKPEPIQQETCDLQAILDRQRRLQHDTAMVRESLFSDASTEHSQQAQRQIKIFKKQICKTPHSMVTTQLHRTKLGLMMRLKQFSIIQGRFKVKTEPLTCKIESTNTSSGENTILYDKQRQVVSPAQS